MRILSLAIVTSVALLHTGCGSGVASGIPADEQSTGLTWDQFRSGVYQEPESGLFIADGDTSIEGEKQLREFFDNHLQMGPLAVHQVNGIDQKWDDQHKLNLSYCVSDSFGARQQQVRDAMAAAVQAWAAAANVAFVPHPEQDAACTSSNGNVVFDVNPVNTGGRYIARSFFPGQGRSSRNILIDNSAFNLGQTPSLTGVLRHELGHTLGFRHEHTRPESGTCFEDNSWRALTSYDSASVMQYPQCNGTGDRTLSLSPLDRAGAATLYGAPSGGTSPSPSPDPTGTARVADLSGSVALREMKGVGTFTVLPGSYFEAVMTGSGDADLYVRFGALPTVTAYACRPYLDGPNESCRLTVPAGQTVANVSVRGYTAATYQLSVHYMEPTPTGTPPPAPTGTPPPAPAGTPPPAPAQSDTVAPTFTGLQSATAVSGSQVNLAWSAATDAVTPAADLVYDVYASTSSTVDLTAPLGASPAGATSVSVSGLSAGTTYYFVVRARDAAGNRDLNSVSRNATTPAAAPASGGSAFEDQVLDLVNQKRAQGASCGGTAFPPAGALVMNAQLRSAAQLHSADMATQNYFSHTSLDGRTFVDRVHAAGYASSTMGENIAAGQPSPQSVVDTWMASPGHCSNIMNSSYHSIGVGYAFSSSSSYGYYWTQDFGGQ